MAEAEQSDHEVRVLAAVRTAGVELIPSSASSSSTARSSTSMPLRTLSAASGSRSTTSRGTGGAWQASTTSGATANFIAGRYVPRVTDEDLDRDFEGTIQELVELYHRRDLAEPPNLPGPVARATPNDSVSKSAHFCALRWLSGRWWGAAPGGCDTPSLP